MKLQDIMTPDPACCAPENDLRDVAVMMVEHDCGEIPVCDEGHKPIGVVTDRDIVCRLVAKGKNPIGVPAREIMSTPVITVKRDTDVEEASRLMEEYQVRRLPVVDPKGALCGMVAQADIAKKARHIAIDVVEKVSQPNVMASSAGGRR